MHKQNCIKCHSKLCGVGVSLNQGKEQKGGNAMVAKARVLALRLYEKQKQKPDVFNKMGVEIKITKKKDERIEENE